MKVYNKQHPYYCGIDLHARTMYVCILDADGNKVYHKNIPCQPGRFLRAIAPFRNGLVVGVECIFCWYWIADLCEAEGIDFILGHALYMKSIHGVKTKNDRIDSLKIARLMRGGNFPVAYVYRHYPKKCIWVEGYQQKRPSEGYSGAWVKQRRGSDLLYRTGQYHRRSGA